MGDWSFLTNHAQVLVCIAHDPGVRLRDIAAKLGITERTAYGIVTDLTQAGYVVKDKNGRRNRYMVQAHLPLRAVVSGERTIGEVLDLLIDADTRRGMAPGRTRTGPADPASKATDAGPPILETGPDGAVVPDGGNPLGRSEIGRRRRVASRRPLPKDGRLLQLHHGAA
jgi:hypothetical protein